MWQYLRACSTHDVEKPEKYAYSVNMCSGLTYSCSCTRKQLPQTSTCSGKYGSIRSSSAAVKKLSQSGDMPKSTNVVSSGAWHSRQWRGESFMPAGAMLSCRVVCIGATSDTAFGAYF